MPAAKVNAKTSESLKAIVNRALTTASSTAAALKTIQASGVLLEGHETINPNLAAGGGTLRCDLHNHLTCILYIYNIICNIYITYYIYIYTSI